MFDFILTAVPELEAVGNETEPRLKQIRFVAIDGYRRFLWQARNTGTFAANFAMILDAGTAQRIINRLNNNETVVFPGLWSIEQIDAHLGPVGKGAEG
jgi:hypothetical protein